MLYLGSAKVADLDTDAEIVAINRKGEVEPHQRAILSDIEGIVLLDGTWSQAKALWWRNAWMLKCQRVILRAEAPVALRQAPARSRAATASPPSRPPVCCWPGSRSGLKIAETLNASFDRMLARYLEVQAEMPELAPKPKKRDYRRASAANARFRNKSCIDKAGSSRVVRCVPCSRRRRAGSNVGLTT